MHPDVLGPVSWRAGFCVSKVSCMHCIPVYRSLLVP